MERSVVSSSGEEQYTNLILQTEKNALISQIDYDGDCIKEVQHKTGMEMADKNNEITTLKDTIEDLKRFISDREEEIVNMRSTNTKLQDKEVYIDELLGKYSEMAEIKTDLEDKNKQMEGQIEEMCREMKSERMKANGLECSLLKKEKIIQKMKKESEHLQHEISELRKKNEEYKGRNNSLSTVIEQHKQEIEKLEENQNEEILKVWTEKQELSDELVLKNELIKSTKDNLEDKLKSTEHKLENTEQKLESSKHKLEITENKLETTEANHNILINENQAMKAKIDSLEKLKSKDNLEDKLKSTEHKLESTEQKLESSKHKLEITENKLETTEGNLNILINENQTMKAKIDSLEKELPINMYSNVSNDVDSEYLTKEKQSESNDIKANPIAGKANEEKVLNLTNENDAMRKQINSLEKRLFELNEECNEEKSRCLIEKLQLEDKITMQNEERNKHKKDLSYCKAHHCTATADEKSKNKTINELTSRLAQEMSNKVSSHEIALENISIKNRPMNIAAEYEMICSNEWHDAKNALDNLYGVMHEDGKIKILRAVYEFSEDEVNKSFQDTLIKVEKILCNPVTYKEGAVSTLAPSASKLSTLKTSLSDILRCNADILDLGTLEQKVCQKTSIHGRAHSDNREFCKFVKAVARLCWKMAIQKPAMHFEQHGVGLRWQGENKQKVFWKSSDPNDANSRVKYYVQPALYHGDIIMVQGQVLLSKNKVFV